MKEQDLMREGFLVALGTILSLVMAAVLVFTMTACNRADKLPEETTYAQVTVVSSYEKDQELYKGILDKLSEDSAYAFADMGDEHDVLLVTEKAFEINGDLETNTARVFGFDKNGTIKEYGVIESDTTSMPLIAGRGAVLFGTHSTMSKATIDEEHSKLEVQTAKTGHKDKANTNDFYNELFDEYANGIVINFTAVE